MKFGANCGTSCVLRFGRAAAFGLAAARLTGALLRFVGLRGAFRTADFLRADFLAGRRAFFDKFKDLFRRHAGLPRRAGGFAREIKQREAGSTLSNPATTNCFCQLDQESCQTFSKSGSRPTKRSTHRNRPSSHGNHGSHSHGNRGSHGIRRNHAKPPERRCQRFPCRRRGTWRGSHQQFLRRRV